ncbi:MAG TPA: prenyltransferase [Methanomicrobia archaeon]|nr:prenyltransferase [Methanomicrobia archaeon]
MRVKEKVTAWLTLSRCTMYYWALITYSLGAAIAYSQYQTFNGTVFALGYLCLLLIELNTVFINEYFDYPSDRINLNVGPFNAGSRMLVEGRLSFREVRIGIVLIAVVLLGAGALLIRATPHIPTVYLLVLAAVALFFGWGYTAPPLKLSYRTWGELADGLMSGPATVVAGFLLQTGIWTDPVPWLVSTPTFLAMAVAAALLAIPDAPADKAIGRQTMAVRFGSRATGAISIWAVILCAIISVLLWGFGFIPNPIGIAMLVIVPLAYKIVRPLQQATKTKDEDIHEKAVSEIVPPLIILMTLVGLIPLLAFVLG